MNYFTSRNGVLKLGKGASQGSIFGPFLFNIFHKFLVLTKYNYADEI